MKLKNTKLTNLRVKSFVTSLNASKINTIKGAGTDDNTAIFGSIQDCKSTTVPIIQSDHENVCIVMPD